MLLKLISCWQSAHVHWLNVSDNLLKRTAVFWGPPENSVITPYRASRKSKNTIRNRTPFQPWRIPNVSARSTTSRWFSLKTPQLVSSAEGFEINCPIVEQLPWSQPDAEKENGTMNFLVWLRPRVFQSFQRWRSFGKKLWSVGQMSHVSKNGTHWHV